MITSPVTANPAAASAPPSTATQSSLSSLGDPNTFLKLLVAQLANQDPQQPADGTTFVTQLATFAGVEQQSQMRSDLDAINTVAQKYSAGPAPQTPPPSSGASGTTPGAKPATGSSN